MCRDKDREKNGLLKPGFIFLNLNKEVTMPEFFAITIGGSS